MTPAGTTALAMAEAGAVSTFAQQPAQKTGWSHPAFACIAQSARQVWARWAQGESLPQVLNTVIAGPMAFAPQAQLPAGEAYEAYVHRNQAVPTRENLHDAFHGLMWGQWPQAKQRMNALQAQEIAMRGTQGPRGAVRDALTVLDENGLLITGSQALMDALRARQWQRLLVQERSLWSQVQMHVLGHALLEQLYARPHKALTAHVYVPQQPYEASKAGLSIDAWLAHDLSAAHLASKPFAPLPILGIPGWCEDNANFSFYDDSSVFRSARRQTATVKQTLENPAIALI